LAAISGSADGELGCLTDGGILTQFTKPMGISDCRA
jgi:hypothetical protein